MFAVEKKQRVMFFTLMDVDGNGVIGWPEYASLMKW